MSALSRSSEETVTASDFSSDDEIGKSFYSDTDPETKSDSDSDEESEIGSESSSEEESDIEDLELLVYVS